MTSLREIPECRHRGEIRGDRCRCHSPRILPGRDGLVPLSVCTGVAWGLERCRYADHEPVTAADRGKSAVTACLYRGSELRKEVCPSCCGHVQVAVFACEVHGECTIAKATGHVARTCAACPDRRTDPPTPEPQMYVEGVSR